MSVFKKMTIATLALLSVASTSANAYDTQNRRIRINNYSSLPVYHLYISNAGSRRWNSDQLGASESIGSNRSQIWNVDDGSGYCRFDFKFVMSDGSTRYKYNYNVCEASYLDVID